MKYVISHEQMIDNKERKTLLYHYQDVHCHVKNEYETLSLDVDSVEWFYCYSVLHCE